MGGAHANKTSYFSQGHHGGNWGDFAQRPGMRARRAHAPMALGARAVTAVGGGGGGRGGAPPPPMYNLRSPAPRHPRGHMGCVTRAALAPIYAR